MLAKGLMKSSIKNQQPKVWDGELGEDQNAEAKKEEVEHSHCKYIHMMEYSLP